MDLGSIFIILALAIAVGLFVARPLLKQPLTGRSTRVVSSFQSVIEDHELSSLMAERDRIVHALQDLDFDFTLGKIPSEDYPTQRSMLLTHGAEVLRRLDEIQGSDQVRSTNVGDVVNAEDRLEAAIAARRIDGVQSQPTAVVKKMNGNGNSRRGIAAVGGDDDIETMLAGRRRERKSKAGGFCSQCGGPVQQSDRFCPRCGAVVNV